MAALSPPPPAAQAAGVAASSADGLYALSYGADLAVVLLSFSLQARRGGAAARPMSRGAVSRAAFRGSVESQS